MAEDVDSTFGGPEEKRQKEDKTRIDLPKEEIKKIDEQVATLNEEFEFDGKGREFYKVNEVCLGFVINTITGDDVNGLATGVGFQKLPQAEKPLYYSSARDRVLGRLDWEINSGLLPERINVQLQKTRDEIAGGGEWNRGNFMKFYNLWKTQVFDLVRADPELSAAEKIYQQFEGDYGESGLVRLKRKLEMREGESRTQAEELKLDPDSVALGLRIDSIISDDSNAFGGTTSIPEEVSQRRVSRRRLMIRLEWEENCRNIPEELRQKIRIVKEELNNFDWTTEQGFRDAYDYWRENLMEWMMEEHQRNPVYKKAYEDYLIVYSQEDREAKR